MVKAVVLYVKAVVCITSIKLRLSDNKYQVKAVDG